MIRYIDSAIVCKCLAMLVILAGCQTVGQKEIAQLQGTWVATEEGSIPEELNITISGDRFEASEASSAKTVSGAVKINPKVSPKEIDLIYDDCIDEDCNGDALRGVYKIENNKLFLVYDETCMERRAKSFNTKFSQGFGHQVFRKQ